MRYQSVSQTATRLGVSKNTVCDWLDGDHQPSWASEKVLMTEFGCLDVPTIDRTQEKGSGSALRDLELFWKGEGVR